MMKKYGLTVFAALLAALLIGLVPARSQDAKEGEKGDESGVSIEEAWMKLQQPGSEHEWLAEDTGEWVVTQRFWMDGMDDPMEVKGESIIEMKWGRYRYEEMAIGEGEAANVVGLMGFDNSAGEFKSVSVGIWGTGMDVMSGTLSVDGKTLNLRNERVEKGLNNLKITERAVITRKGDDERLVEVFSKYGDAPERKVGEIAYTRKK